MRPPSTILVALHTIATIAAAKAIRGDAILANTQHLPLTSSTLFQLPTSRWSTTVALTAPSATRPLEYNLSSRHTPGETSTGFIMSNGFATLIGCSGTLFICLILLGGYLSSRRLQAQPGRYFQRRRNTRAMALAMELDEATNFRQGAREVRRSREARAASSIAGSRARREHLDGEHERDLPHYRSFETLPKYEEVAGLEVPENALVRS